MTLKVIQAGHIKPPLFQNNSSTFVYGPMKICINANMIMKTQFLIKLYKT